MYTLHNKVNNFVMYTQIYTVYKLDKLNKVSCIYDFSQLVSQIQVSQTH